MPLQRARSFVGISLAPGVGLFAFQLQRYRKLRPVALYACRVSTQRLLSLAIRWLLLAFAVWVAARIVAGIHLEGTGSTLAVALILGLLNLYLRPVLFLISLPLTILTLGLFIIVINAILLLLTDLIAGWFGVSFEVEGLLPAVLGAIIISIVNLVTSALVPADSLARRLVGGY